MLGRVSSPPEGPGDARLHLAGAWGCYAHFDDYLERAVDMSRRSAYRFIRIAEHFSAEIAARYGVTKLDAEETRELALSIAAAPFGDGGPPYSRRVSGAGRAQPWTGRRTHLSRSAPAPTGLPPTQADSGEGEDLRSASG